MLILPIVVGTVGLLALTYKLYQWSKPKQADPAVLELLRAQGTLVITFVSLANLTVLTARRVNMARPTLPVHHTLSSR